MKISSPIVMAYPGPPRRAAGIIRYIIVSAVIVTVLYYLRHSVPSAAFDPPSIPQTKLPIGQSPQHPVEPSTDTDVEQPIAKPEPEQPVTAPKATPHPIDTLIEAAEKT